MIKLFLSIMLSITFSATVLVSTDSEAIAETEKPIVLRLSTFGPAVGKTERMLQKWADKVKEKSKGRVKIDESFEKGIQKSWEEMNHTIVKSTKEEMEAWRLAMQPLHKALIEKYEAKGVPAGEIFERSKQIITNYSK